MELNDHSLMTQTSLKFWERYTSRVEMEGRTLEHSKITSTVVSVLADGKCILHVAISSLH